MKLFKVIFTGCTANALGARHPIETTVHAVSSDKEDIRLGVYRAGYEKIRDVTIVEELQNDISAK